MNEGDLALIKAHFEDAVEAMDYDLAQEIVADMNYHGFKEEAARAQLVINKFKASDLEQLEDGETLRSITTPNYLYGQKRYRDNG